MSQAAPPRLSAPSTAAQHALHCLRSLIVSGTLRPGQRVNQDALAEQMGLSVAPVREALRALEQEGQVTYLPRRGYFVTELKIEDLEEIYALRALLEERAARSVLPRLGKAEIERLARAAKECEAAADLGDVARELDANRSFHFLLLAGDAHPHLMRLIRLLWDSTEAYRALYYNSPAERRHANAAHARILRAARAGDADRLVAEMDAHRERALQVLRAIL
jgi:DNA-binding GntR family transcriptional regulator